MNHMPHHPDPAVKTKKYFLVFNPKDNIFERVYFKEISNDQQDSSTSTEN